MSVTKPGGARPAWLVTCEHGGHEVPHAFIALFAGAEALLRSHRGWDAGALEMARRLSERLGAPLLASCTTRLLVDLNRSVGHPRLFSELTRPLPRAVRMAILAEHYWPYRKEVERRITAAIAAGERVLHVSSHSFVPVLDGERRRADVGLLYDPRSALERALCAAWRDALRTTAPDLVVRRNYPYRGTADGLVTWLRRRYPATAYAAVELEINQRLLGRPDWEARAALIIAALEHAAPAALEK